MPFRALFPLLIAGLLALPPGTARSDDLPRRAFLGIGYRALTAAEAESLQVEGGLVVNRVLPGGPAEAAGLREGDVIRSIDGEPISSESELRTALRPRHAGDEIRLAVARAGTESTLTLLAGGAPEERADGVHIEYTSFESGGVRLRAVVASPPDAAGKRLPALLLVSALGSPQLIGGSFHSAGREMAYAAARAGYRALRVELRGAGDSEGEDYRTTDFETEIADNLAAFDYLAGRPDVQPGRLFVYGHSTGGIEAAVVASRRPAAGLIVSCTVGRTHFERMADTIRLQGELAGDPEGEIDRGVAARLAFVAAILRGAGAAELSADSTFAGYFNRAGRIMDDRTVAYWRQQLRLPLAEVYSRVSCPTLVLHAASDFLTQRACHERIRDLLIAAGNAGATFREIPGVDHAYSRARDVRESFERYRTGDFQYDPAPAAAIVEWLRER